MSSEGALIDDQEFLDDLQNLVNEPPHAPYTPEVRAARMPENAFDALIGGDNDDHLGAREGSSPERVATMWPEERDEAAARGPWDVQAPPQARVSRALTAMFLVVCAATGAGLSALVFHNRVVQMIALWTR
jgi:hypothetical protein